MKIIEGEMGQKDKVARYANKCAIPLKITYLGYRCMTCAFSPVILYEGRLVLI